MILPGAELAIAAWLIDAQMRVIFWAVYLDRLARIA